MPTRQILITCGCSWTYGVGAGYQTGMSKDEYNNIAWNAEICEEYSFRKILADKYNCKNINLSIGGSSNQKQFRLLKQFLTSDQCTQLLQQDASITVLHGITSTARTEMYLNERNELVNWKFDQPGFEKYSSPMLEHFYNHDNEVERLAAEMIFMNQYYRAVGIKNLWFDTFNHHEYPVAVDNLIEPQLKNRDMLSTMASLNGLSEFDKVYHASSWKIDSNRIQLLVDCGYLNPITVHPTKQGHAMIADIINKQLERIM